MLRFSRRNNSKVSRITFADLGFSERENSVSEPMTKILLAFLVRALRTSVDSAPELTSALNHGYPMRSVVRYESERGILWWTTCRTGAVRPAARITSRSL
jgi:hypothetical protein